MKKFERIKQSIIERNYYLSSHAEEEMLDDDLERRRRFAIEAQQVTDHDQVPGAGNRQELGQAFHYAQNQGLKGHPDIHQIPQSAASTYA